ncbi:carbohydrate sulfotransferase 1-like [Uloborus diversus]|uniref:carbohydrate sulfotransferase 1-like n=1 Tax=Uloborus diversus TaxID=327109 RepID=UPI00240A5A61|nr:carbohydrate sulfotransferase 1-like [Uloborus diversus]
MKSVEEIMSRSRRFLLLLLLVTLTGVILVQLSLDGWDLGATFTYGEHTKELKVVHASHASNRTESSLHIETVKESTVSTTSTSVQTTKLVHYEIKPITSPLPTRQRIQARRLPLGREPSKENPKQLISKQDRLQEILKHSSSVRSRSSVDPMRALKSIPLIKSEDVNRIIILTYFRAGSSFFGDLLQQNWKTFYHFEPLHYMTYDSRIGDEKVSEVFDLFEGLFKCNFTELRDYTNWVRSPRNQFLFGHNHFLWVACHGNPKVCFNSSFVNAVCQRAPIHVMKVTRLHMRHLRDYLENNPDLKFKVVYLTRDPRGIVSSRWTLDWCNETNCSDSNVLCREMDEDIEIFNELQKRDPSNFIKVRYEDLSLKTEEETKELFKFLKLPYSTTVQKFLKTHTVGKKADDKNPYSTKRNTTSMAFSWRERFTFQQVVNVQSYCETTIQKLNHSLITSPSQLPYPNGKKTTKPTPQNQVRKSKRFNKNPLYQKLIQQEMMYTVTPKHDKENILNKKSTKIKIHNNTNIEIHKTYKVVGN